MISYSSDTGLAALYLNGQQAASVNFPVGQQGLASNTDLLIGKKQSSVLAVRL